MKPIAIIKAGGTFPDLARRLGDFETWMQQGMGVGEDEVRAIAVASGEQLDPAAAYSAAVITGSHAMVTDAADWMITTASWLREAVAAGLPTLGVCFGHQLLAMAFGGRAGWNPRGREIGTAEIVLTDAGREDPLLNRLPTRFPAQVTHRQSVLELPPSARLLATSPGDPHQAFRLGSAWGVQFHPEFSAPAMQHYIAALAPELDEEGLNPERLLASLGPTPAATSVLSRFVSLARTMPEQSSSPG